MALAETPRSALARCERIISAGMESFIEVGKALAEVRDSKLYEGKYKTFEDYCEQRWEFGRHCGYLLISAAKVMESVDNCQHRPANEAQARELGKAPEKDRKKVMKAAAAAAPKDDKGKPKITAAIIEKAVSDTVPLNEAMGKTKPKKPAKAKSEPDTPKAEKVIDGCGNVVTDPHLMIVFKARADFKAIQNQIRALQKAVKEMGDAKHEGAALFVNLQGHDIALDALWAAFKFEMPYALCPFCKGKGVGKCKQCRNAGFMPKNIYTVVPEESRWPEAVGTT